MLKHSSKESVEEKQYLGNLVRTNAIRNQREKCTDNKNNKSKEHEL